MSSRRTGRPTIVKAAGSLVVASLSTLSANAPPATSSDRRLGKAAARLVREVEPPDRAADDREGGRVLGGRLLVDLERERAARDELAVGDAAPARLRPDRTVGGRQAVRRGVEPLRGELDQAAAGRGR